MRTVSDRRGAGWHLVLCLLAAAATPSSPAAADEKHDVRPRVRPGLAIAFVMTTETKVDLKAEGKRLAVEARMTGTLTYAEVGANGQPTAGRVAFGADCTTKRTLDGKAQVQPFALAGKAVNLKRGKDGRVTHDAQGVDAATADMLKRLLSIDTMVYPTTAVEVGDEWAPPPERLPPEMTFNGLAKADVRCKLVKVGDLRGRRTYDVVLTGKVAGELQPGTPAQMDFGGLTQIDAETGVPAQAEMAMNVSVKDARQGYDMQMKISATYTFPAAAGPATKPAE